MIKKGDTPTYIINKNIIKRFSQRSTIFGRKLFDKEADFYHKGMYDNSLEIIADKKKDIQNLTTQK